jgi:hypothetical protein
LIGGGFKEGMSENANVEDLSVVFGLNPNLDWVERDLSTVWMTT